MNEEFARVGSCDRIHYTLNKALDKEKDPSVRNSNSKLLHVATSCCSNVRDYEQDNTRSIPDTMGKRGRLTIQSNEIPLKDGKKSLDLELGLAAKHILVDIEGMDCAGCERQVYKSLKALPELSNIRVNFLQAQAEFDMLPSKPIRFDNIAQVIEKMTGYTCSIASHSGAKLELTVEGKLDEFFQSAVSYPKGVIDVSKISKKLIQVSYLPSIIGARDLLSHPAFQTTKLAPHLAPPAVASGRKMLIRSFYVTIFSAILTTPVLIMAWAPHPTKPLLYGAVSLALATIIQFVVTMPFYIKAFKALVFSRMIDMDVLIVLSSSAAYIYSVVAYALLAVGKPLQTEQFFETSTLLITLIMVGRTVGAFAQQKAIESIVIESLQTPSAILYNELSHREEEIDSRLLHYGDVFKVMPDVSIATDGVVISGKSEVDESMISGEATLVVKHPGDTVVAGSINYSGLLLVEVTKLPFENTIKSISAMVDEAKSSKPKVQDLADRVSSFFVPIILTTTMVVFGVWVAIGSTIRHDSITTSCINAMTFAMSVLIVSCPCAIGLAIPIVVVIAGGVAAGHGIIFKTAETIDIGRKVSHVVFDKTGTLTRGSLSVIAEEYLDEHQSLSASIILGLATNSKHPASKAITAHLTAQGSQPICIIDIVSVAGYGVEALWSNKTCRLGSPSWLGVNDHPTVGHILAQGLTTICVTLDDVLIAVFGLIDSLRPDALETLEELRRRSITVSMVSGDNEEVVKSTAAKLRIPISQIRSCCSPEDKQGYVKTLLESKEGAIVLFVGDGTNDAPSLAQASVGLHICDGTDVAASAADAVLMRPSLQGVITLIDLSKAFHRRVVFNFAWSFVYNFFAVLLAGGAFSAKGNVRIPPQYAGLGEVVSVVPVILIAMGLKWWKA